VFFNFNLAYLTFLERKYISYQQSQFSYLKYGNGNKILVCLHGFGENADTFSFIEKYVEQDFTVYALDMPMHGHTLWQNKLTFPIKSLIELMSLIIPDFNTQRIHLLCYSMGGRIGLSLLERIPHKIEKAVLLAPDGLTVSAWYWLATQTWLGNGLFKYTMRFPQWFAWIVNMMNRMKWVNSSVAKYVHHYIDDEKIRTDLYRIWTTMRKFRPDLPHVKKVLAENKIPLHLVFGAYDRIILSKHGYVFQKGAEEWIHVHELQTGHLLLKEKHAAAIISFLNDE